MQFDRLDLDAAVMRGTAANNGEHRRRLAGLGLCHPVVFVGWRYAVSGARRGKRIENGIDAIAGLRLAHAVDNDQPDTNPAPSPRWSVRRHAYSRTTCTPDHSAVSPQSTIPRPAAAPALVKNPTFRL